MAKRRGPVTVRGPLIWQIGSRVSATEGCTLLFNHKLYFAINFMV
jgi:hypothetical protein